MLRLGLLLSCANYWKDPSKPYSNQSSSVCYISVQQTCSHTVWPQMRSKENQGASPHRWRSLGDCTPSKFRIRRGGPRWHNYSNLNRPRAGRWMECLCLLHYLRPREMWKTTQHLDRCYVPAWSKVLFQGVTYKHIFWPQNLELWIRCRKKGANGQRLNVVEERKQGWEVASQARACASNWLYTHGQRPEGSKYQNKGILKMAKPLATNNSPLRACSVLSIKNVQFFPQQTSN